MGPSESDGDLGDEDRGGDGGDAMEAAGADADPGAIRQTEIGLVDRLRQAGFEGEPWHSFAEELFMYGQRVLLQWFADGTIVARCRDRNLLATPIVWHGWSPDDQHDLLMDTLTNAVAAYREVLRRGYWNSAGGASLRTYFIGQALMQFGRVYKRFLDDREKLVLLDPDRLFRRGDITAWMQPERVAIFRAELERRLAGLSGPRSRQVVLLDALGYSYAEIGSRAGLSPRAVEGRLRRARARLREISDDFEPPIEKGSAAG